MFALDVVANVYQREAVIARVGVALFGFGVIHNERSNWLVAVSNTYRCTSKTILLIFGIFWNVDSLHEFIWFKPTHQVRAVGRNAAFC